MTASNQLAVAPDAFMAKVAKVASGCWQWQGAINNGYGAIKGRGAHRVGYQLFKGPIPDGLELDHLCRNRACVNPQHLEPMTHLENVRRSPIHVSILSRKSAAPRLKVIAAAVRAHVDKAKLARELGMSRARLYQLIAKCRERGYL